MSPEYAKESNPERWTQEIVELASPTPATAQPTLLFYTYGDQSQYLTREVAKLPTKEKKDAFLYDFFKPYYSRLPHYEEHYHPVGCYATSWLHDELAGNGSYSNFQTGLTKGDEDVAVMREGLPERGLWFAGEHTSPLIALGTATGAYCKPFVVLKFRTPSACFPTLCSPVALCFCLSGPRTLQNKLHDHLF